MVPMASAARLTCLTILALVCLLAPRESLAQAQEPGASVSDRRIDRELYVNVNHPAATDRGSRAGRSADRPFASISRAIEFAKPLLRDAQSVRISIAPGIYREAVEFEVGEDTQLRDATFVIQGDPEGGAILSGSSPEGFGPETWRPVPDHPNLFEHAWDKRQGIDWGPWGDRWGVHYDGVTARSELLFVDGRRLTPVEIEVYEWEDPDGPARNKPGDNVDGKLVYRGIAEEGWGVLTEPWQFAVADHPESPEPFRQRIVMRLPEGVTPADLKSIEVGAIHTPVLTFRGKHNLIIRDLTVQRVATHFQDQAVKVNDCSNVLVENLEVHDVGGSGLSLSGCDRATLRNARLVRCGQNGFGGTRFRNTLIDECDFSFNNWRGELSGFVGWNTSGIKVTRLQNVIFRRCTAVGNAAHGFWNDVFNRNVVYDRCLAYGNLRKGIFFELSGKDPADGDDLATHCVSAFNGEWGFYFTNARRPAAENCLSINNGDGQFGLRRSGERDPYTAEGFEWKMIRNSHAISQVGSPLVGIHAYPSRGGDDLFAVLRIDHNVYETSNPSEAFWRQERGDFSLEEWRSQLAERGAWDMNDQSSTLVEIPSYQEEPLDLTDPSSRIYRLAEQLGVRLPLDDMRQVSVPVSQ